SSYQTIFDRAKSSGYRPVWLDGYEVQGKTYFNVTFHPQANVVWLARHGMSAAEYQAQFDSATKDGHRLTNLASYVSGDSVTNAAVGRQLAYLSAYQKGGGMRFSAIFQQKTPGSGSTVGRHNLTGPQLQAEYDEELAAGRLTRVLVGYEVNGTAMFAAAWRKAA